MRQEKNFILIQEDADGNFQMKSKYNSDDTLAILESVADMVREVQLETIKEEQEMDDPGQQS